MVVRIPIKCKKVDIEILTTDELVHSSPAHWAADYGLRTAGAIINHGQTPWAALYWETI